MHYAKVYPVTVRVYSGQKMSQFHDAGCNTFTDSSDKWLTVCWSTCHVCYSYWKHLQINVFLWQPYTVGKTDVILKFVVSTDVESLLYKQIVHPCPLTKIAARQLREDGMTVVQRAHPQTLHARRCKRKFKWNSGWTNDYNELIEYRINYYYYNRPTVEYSLKIVI